MTELQIGLLGTGAVIVIGVIVYNQLQIRRSRPHTLFENADQDARRASAADSAARPSSLEATVAAEDEAVAAMVSDAASRQARLASRPVIDPLIDCMVTIRLDSPVNGERVLSHVSQIRHSSNKPVHVEGLRADAGEWEPVHAGTAYSELQAGLQLANRAGPVNSLEFSGFVSACQQLATALDGHADAPNMNEVLTNAQELDAFAAQCDVQLAIHVVSNGPPWSAAMVQGIATQDSLVLSRDGTRFAHFPDLGDAATGSGVRPAFTLQLPGVNFLRDDLTQKSADRITLTLDVPHVPAALAPFRTMWSYAQHLAPQLGARVVDDNQRPVPEQVVLTIEQQLSGLYAQLDARGLSAGSAAAQRLFSN